MGYFGSKATSGLCQALIALMPPHSVYIESHLGGGALMKRKPTGVRSIGIDRDAQALEAFACDYPVELVHGCAHAFLASFPFLGPELVYSDPPQGKLVHSLGLSWLDRGAAFPRMIGSPAGRFADGGMSGPRWGSGYGLTITCRHIGALRLRSGAGPSAWRFALPVEGGRALRVSGWVVAVYWRSF